MAKAEALTNGTSVSGGAAIQQADSSNSASQQQEERRAAAAAKRAERHKEALTLLMGGKPEQVWQPPAPEQVPELAWQQEQHRIFLEAIGREVEGLHLRAIRPLTAAESTWNQAVRVTGQWKHLIRNVLKIDRYDLHQLNQLNQKGYNIYLVMGAGGQDDAAITHVTGWWADLDTGTPEQQLERLFSGPVPPTAVVWTGGKGYHAHWRAPAHITDRDQWGQDIARVIAAYGADPACSNPSRVLRLPGFMYWCKHDKDPEGVSRVKGTAEVTEVLPDACYSREEFISKLPELPEAERKLLARVSKADKAASALASASKAKTRIPARSMEQVEAALEKVPQRPGSSTGTYQHYRRILMGLCWAVEEAGGSHQDALDLMELHSPSGTCGWDVQQTYESSDLDYWDSGIFWVIVSKDYGYSLKRSDMTPADWGKVKAEAVKDIAGTINRNAAASGLPDFVELNPNGSHTAPAQSAVDVEAEPVDEPEEAAQGQVKADEPREFENPLLEALGPGPGPFVNDKGVVLSPSVGGWLTHVHRAVEDAGLSIRFNLLTKRIEYGSFVIPSDDLELEYILLNGMNWKVSQKTHIDVVRTLARGNAYHPVKEYLMGVLNDEQVDAADVNTLAAEYLEAPDPLHNAMLKAWLIGAVKRIFYPGCKHDSCLVLQGPQGAQKSSFFEALAGEDNFTDSSSDNHKDYLLLVHSKWILEMGELESITGRKEVGELRRFISTRSDDLRVPYGRTTENYKRQSIFCGTVNPAQFLRDEQGNRRFWTIPVKHTFENPIDVERVKRERDRIWKAAVLAMLEGEANWLAAEHHKASEDANAEFTVGDPWVERLERFRFTQPFTTDQAIRMAELRQATAVSRTDQMRAADALKRAGYVRSPQPLSTATGRARLWWKGEGWWRDPEVLAGVKAKVL